MRNQQTETAKPILLNSVLERLYTPIVRSCLLNLIAQIAMGTPIAAEAQRDSGATQIYEQKQIARDDYRDSVDRKPDTPEHAQPESQNLERRCPAASRPNVLAMEVGNNETL